MTMSEFDQDPRDWRQGLFSLSHFFFFSSFCNVRGNTLLLKCYPNHTDGICTLFQTIMAKSVPYFRLEMLEDDNPLGRHIPTIPDKIVDTPPLPPHSMLVNAQFGSKFVSWPLDCRTNIEPGGGGGGG